jgi:serine/threonine protein kinase
MASASAIGPYRILEPLGHGGMGVVYRARHTGSERAVALKTVKISAPKWLDSIRREIDALTRIRHPGIVRIVEHGVHEGRPWYAMDLLEGESLRHFGDRIWSPYRSFSAHVGSTDAVGATDDASGEFPATAGLEPEPRSGNQIRASGALPVAAGELRAVLHLVRRVCATLAFLHGEGFVNCDLKPENVVLVADQPVIIDFGLTAHHPGGSGREALEVQRAMSGTLPYMSPEQIRGEFVDARSDIYSIGCMLYELVTGRPPFLGAPRAIMSQHLSSPPVPPSELVEGLSSELERVMLKLLEKELPGRFGFADEVAAVLAELSGDVHRLPHFPPARPYLYRPRFVGRDPVVAKLAAMRDRASAGSGSIALLAGESGVGKTRVAMELTRVLPSFRMRIVTSESSLLSTPGAGPVGSAPLNAVRPLLRAAADRCQEGGAEVTDRLLGERRSVLALYEPLLAQVPAKEDLTPPVPLALEASRQRLFRYLAEMLASFAHDQPILWVLDDLSWADELSLDFLKSLTREYLESTPVFILGTYRSEEVTDPVTEIAGLPHVTQVDLPRLQQNAVSSMIADMLALTDPKDDFVEFVGRQAEGNPFFVAEHVRTAVTERVLFRDNRYSWQIAGRTGGGAISFESLPLPRSLRELIDHRLRKLTPLAQEAGVVAAVIGREMDVDVLEEIGGFSEGAAAVAMDELLRRQILEQPEPGRVRFAHDKLREVVYTQAPAERLKDLHARAGLALEARWRDRPDASVLWVTLGHHFAAGHVPEPAARYLSLAAHHARATHANGDAIRLYREAINQANEIVLRLASDSASSYESLAELSEALADVLALTGKRDESREAYAEALGRIADEKTAARARIHRKIGKTWETQHQHEDALRFYESAKRALGADPVNASQEHRDEWIQLHIEEVWVYYWLGKVPRMDAVVAGLRPLIEQHGSTAQRVRFLQGQMQLNLRRDRYVVREETLGFARSAAEACDGVANLSELPMARFNHGFALLLHNSLELAEVELQSAFALARHAGDAPQQARCLTYLTLAARMRGQIEATRAYAVRSAEAAAAAGMRDYVAAARSNLAWLALRDGDVDSAALLAREAVDIWKNLALAFPLQWMALLPLLNVEMRRGNLAEAVVCAESLLAPTQQDLPGTAADALGRAVRAWREGGDDVESALSLALRHLERSVYR